MMHSQTFELLTPCFCAGFSKSRPELRVPSVRGQLRWWVRLLQGERSEYAHFGGIKGRDLEYPDEAVKSLWKLRLVDDSLNADPEDKCLVPHKSPNKGFIVKALPAGQRYTLTWQPQFHPNFARPITEKQSQEFQRLLKVWMLLGTVGRRTTRAMGSVWPVNFAPTLEEFASLMAGLVLPATIRWKVLDQTGLSDDLTRIAGETVHGLQKEDFEGDPLGYVNRSQRKSSPLRFKLGRFADGLRLIALWDNRPDRGGNLASALPALSPPLRDLMADFLADIPVSLPSNIDPVDAMLHAPFVFDSIALYKRQVAVWQANHDDLYIRKFVERTQDQKYAGLRSQPWYSKL